MKAHKMVGHQEAAALCIIVLFLILSHAMYALSPSADFEALWLAGQAMAAGHLDQIYPADQTLFTMRPPEPWVELALAEGRRGEMFPFIYPPIWAWIAAKLSLLMGLDSVLLVVRPLNALLILGMLLSARKLAAPNMSLGLYLLIGLIAIMGSSIGTIALYQSQPQIFVAFLVVFAVERAEHGASRTAGACLALAAAIKLYPALFAILWLAQRKYGAAAYFALFGAALGLLSVAVAGWPLHLEFLRILGVVSHTAVLTPLNYSWESVAARLIWPDLVVSIDQPLPPLHGAGSGGWDVMNTPSSLYLVGRIAQVVALVGAWFLFVRCASRPGKAFLWPAAFTIFAMLGPLAWSYYYLAAVAFLPAIASRLGLGAAILLVAAMLILLSPFVTGRLLPEGLEPPTVRAILQSFGAGTMTVLAMLFVALGIRPGPDQANLSAAAMAPHSN